MQYMTSSCNLLSIKRLLSAGILYLCMLFSRHLSGAGHLDTTKSSSHIVIAITTSQHFISQDPRQYGYVLSIRLTTVYVMDLSSGLVWLFLMIERVCKASSID
ncbi:hypothetical protein N7G274_009485 [Stereocaulon virgatum]|uniref:Uncharacterized protein n=1 Tax=Stereocaulon virgatum TaxID=373712 RepID=A0ABR3ZVY5_9LECA